MSQIILTVSPNEAIIPLARQDIKNDATVTISHDPQLETMCKNKLRKIPRDVETQCETLAKPEISKFTQTYSITLDITI